MVTTIPYLVQISMYSILLALPLSCVEPESRQSPLPQSSEEPGDDEVPAPEQVHLPTTLVVPTRPRNTYSAMEICGTRLSPLRMGILAAQIDRITLQYIPRMEWREAFVGLLCIESRFDSTAKSSAGAVGISQLMPRYSQSFATECSLGTLSEGDLVDTEVQLTLGACHFGKLLEALDGNIALALSGYNSGQDSATTRRLSHLIEGNPETMAYVAKFYTFSQQLEHSTEVTTTATPSKKGK